MYNYVSNFRATAGSNDNQEYDVIPNGKYTVRVEKAEEKTSQKGNEMIMIKLKVASYNTPLTYFIMLKGATKEEQEKTNIAISRFMFTFGIPFGEFDFGKWVNKIGKVEIETQDGSRFPRVKFLDYNKDDFNIAVADYNSQPGESEAGPEDFMDDNEDIPF